MNIHPAMKYNLFNMPFSFTANLNYFRVLTFNFVGGISEMAKPFSFIFSSTTDSFLSSMSFFLPSTNAERNSFASLFNLAILCTLLSALCELAIITKAKNETNKIILQFFNASSLTRKVPFNMFDTLFLITAFSQFLILHFLRDC